MPTERWAHNAAKLFGILLYRSRGHVQFAFLTVVAKRANRQSLRIACGRLDAYRATGRQWSGIGCGLIQIH